MSKYNSLLRSPEGTGDLFLEEVNALHEVSGKLNRLFRCRGYSEVITPGIEHYSLFNGRKRRFPEEKLYTLTDKNGRLAVLCPDITLPIARLAASRLKNETFPLKLCYTQNIFRVHRRNSAKDDEITQSGIEIIGGEPFRSDIEAVTLAVSALELLGIENYKFELSSNVFLEYFIRDLPGNENSREELREQIRELVKKKNVHELKKITNDNIIPELSSLFGGDEVFSKAEKLFAGETFLSEQIEYIKKLYNLAGKLVRKGQVTVDFAPAKKAGYYTGVMFRTYVTGFGHSVLSGGRYDGLFEEFDENVSATGFAANVSAISKCIKVSGHKPAEVLVFAEKGKEELGALQTAEFTAQGIAAEYCLCETEEEAMEYAGKKSIERIEVVR
jgi:ATP phosphoribosyltransferase regulatory subunit